MSEDIQYAGSDTRPPMLDRTDFESWQQRIRLYCLGKDNGENIMKSITEEVFAGPSAEQWTGNKADIRTTNILLKFKTAELLFRMFKVDTMRIIKEDHFRGTMQEEMCSGNAGACPQPKRPQDSNYFKDKMLLMNAHENGVVLDEEQLLFLTGEHVTNFDDDVDDLALNVDHVFEAGDSMRCSSTLMFDEALTTQDNGHGIMITVFVDHMDEYHEVHEMQSDVQHNYVVDSDADYTSDSNIILYDQVYKVDENDRKKTETSVPKPLSALTVYPPNTLSRFSPEFFQLKSSED
ncbi:hypothetical protein Tco_0866232 [Tanacetum coccineum]